ncbi:DUF3343 domain-containing protein [Paramaledivibacter caminithermalis]|jgi:hypothetical protein|uniref:Putative Se/S carrier protein-like domain-containing protein n=1 Tax=Paramaledivibacter caminithermalis (strain DSM 15212 / CIP 107654 / DViRD3) TaxID=1121301 RepID=A0A1M6MNE8_PARC5|nr:DUF3343 domain-containing protein [Paramaledivibacter caminithermalis]SHJ85035.1 Protein of unknown function [Paramaledivibacter caminithermalis DSM 15212]
MKEYIALFFTHSGAIKFQRFSKKNNIDCELMPVPRKLSSNCGVCARFNFDGNINDLINEEIEQIYEIINDAYKLIYEEK